MLSGFFRLLPFKACVQDWILTAGDGNDKCIFYFVKYVLRLPITAKGLDLKANRTKYKYRP